MRDFIPCASTEAETSNMFYLENASYLNIIINDDLLLKSMSSETYSTFTGERFSSNTTI